MFSEASANLSVSTVFTLFLRELVVVCCADVTRRTLNIRDNIKVVLLAPKKRVEKQEFLFLSPSQFSSAFILMRSLICRGKYTAYILISF